MVRSELRIMAVMLAPAATMAERSVTTASPALLQHYLRGGLVQEPLGLRQRQQPLPLPPDGAGAATTFCAVVLGLAARRRSVAVARNRSCRESRTVASAAAQEQDEVPAKRVVRVCTACSRRNTFLQTMAVASTVPASAQAEEVDPRTKVRVSSLYADIAIRDYSGDEDAKKNYTIDITKCIICVGKGLNRCISCEGSGQVRMIGRANEDRGLMARNQYKECPDCGGLGEQVCPKCYGTGMPSDKLRGFMRDPKFAKVLFRLKRQRVDVNTVDKMQRDIKQAIAAAESRAELKAAKKAADAAEAAAPAS